MFSIRKTGKHWYARGTIPVRKADGKISRKRIELSTGETSKAGALRAANRLWDYYSEQAYRPTPKATSFLDAAIVYAETKHPSKRDKAFAAKLVQHFGDTPISEIDQAAVADAAHRLYPDCKAATHVRCVYAPVTTILRLSGVNPLFFLPKIEKKAAEIPPEEWFKKVIPACPPRLAAILVFMTLTGWRISEAINAERDESGRATVQKRKTGGPDVVDIPVPCRALLATAGPTPSKRLFGYSDRHNVYRALKPICKRLGLHYYPPHSAGRHSFASRLLRQGKSLKFVKEAGGWKTIKMPAELYGHLEQSDVADEVQRLGEVWGKLLGKGPESD